MTHTFTLNISSGKIQNGFMQIQLRPLAISNRYTAKI